MSQSILKDFNTVVQYTSAGISLFVNSCLVYLILTKSPKKLGPYKNLMIYFACILVFLSFLEVMEKPCVMSNGTTFTVFVERKSFLDSESETFLLSLSCGICGMTMSMFAVHFVFRYFAVERKGKLKYFHGRYLICWMLLPVFVGILWSFIVFIFIGVTERQNILNDMGDLINETYGFNVDDLDLVGAVYYKVDQNNNKIPNTRAIIGMSLLAVIMTISFSVIVYFGIKIKLKIDQLEIEGRSAYTKSLQKQLFYALVIQTILPILFVFAPLGMIFYLPILNIDIKQFSQVGNLALAIYPALDPFPTMFVVDNYRKAVKEYFYSCTVFQSLQRVGPTPEAETENPTTSSRDQTQ